MEERLSSLEKEVAAIKADVAVIRSNYVTQSDLVREISAVRIEMGAMELRIIKWFIGTSVTLVTLCASISFALGRYLN